VKTVVARRSSSLIRWGRIEAGTLWPASAPAPACLLRQTRERIGRDPVDVTVGEVFRGRRPPDLDMIVSYVPLLRGAVLNVRLKVHNWRSLARRASDHLHVLTDRYEIPPVVPVRDTSPVPARRTPDELPAPTTD
jgi:hypothetical protein